MLWSISYVIESPQSDCHMSDKVNDVFGFGLKLKRLNNYKPHIIKGIQFYGLAVN